jgi:hypothetical protein
MKRRDPSPALVVRQAHHEGLILSLSKDEARARDTKMAARIPHNNKAKSGEV